jgi:hypothetical protein
MEDDADTRQLVFTRRGKMHAKVISYTTTERGYLMAIVVYSIQI